MYFCMSIFVWLVFAQAKSALHGIGKDWKRKWYIKFSGEEGSCLPGHDHCAQCCFASQVWVYAVFVLLGCSSGFVENDERVFSLGHASGTLVSVPAGMDYGGVSREFFLLLSTALFDPATGIFTRFKDDAQGLVSKELCEVGELLNKLISPRCHKLCKLLKLESLLCRYHHSRQEACCWCCYSRHRSHGSDGCIFSLSLLSCSGSSECSATGPLQAGHV